MPVCPPLLDRGKQLAGYIARGRPGPGELDDLGTGVVGVRCDLDLTDPFEVRQLLADRLLGDARQLGDLPDPQTLAAVEEPQHVGAQRKRHLSVTGRGKLLIELGRVGHQQL